MIRRVKEDAAMAVSDMIELSDKEIDKGKRPITGPIMTAAAAGGGRAYLRCSGIPKRFA